MLSKQELIEMHPLLRRLSGQAVWCMFEEHGADSEDVTAFLDLYERQKDRTLETFGLALGNAGRAEFHAMLVRVGDNARPCAYCKRVHNRVLLLDNVGLPTFFPPYGLGCPAKAFLLTKGEFSALKNPVFMDTAQKPPSALLCSDWIFTHPWRDHKGTVEFFDTEIFSNQLK